MHRSSVFLDQVALADSFYLFASYFYKLTDSINLDGYFVNFLSF